MKTDAITELQYIEAIARVKKIKGFYIHLIVYLIVNLMIVLVNIQDLDVGESYFKIENFFTACFWGIGLTSHAFSTFLPNWIFGKNWEDKKIRKLMEKERQENWE